MRNRQPSSQAVSRMWRSPVHPINSLIRQAYVLFLFQSRFFRKMRERRRLSGPYASPALRPMSGAFLLIPPAIEAGLGELGTVP